MRLGRARWQRSRPMWSCFQRQDSAVRPVAGVEGGGSWQAAGGGGRGGGKRARGPAGGGEGGGSWRATRGWRALASRPRASPAKVADEQGRGSTAEDGVAASG